MRNRDEMPEIHVELEGVYFAWVNAFREENAYQRASAKVIIPKHDTENIRRCQRAIAGVRARMWEMHHTSPDSHVPIYDGDKLNEQAKTEKKAFCDYRAGAYVLNVGAMYAARDNITVFDAREGNGHARECTTQAEVAEVTAYGYGDVVVTFRAYQSLDTGGFGIRACTPCIIIRGNDKSYGGKVQVCTAHGQMPLSAGEVDAYIHEQQAQAIARRYGLVLDPPETENVDNWQEATKGGDSECSATGEAWQEQEPLWEEEEEEEEPSLSGQDAILSRRAYVPPKEYTGAGNPPETNAAIPRTSRLGWGKLMRKRKRGGA